MNIYLLRHGIALAQTDTSPNLDHERPLSDKGSKRMRKAAKGLMRLSLPFDVVLTSPFVRARQTAEIVASTLGIESLLEELPELAPGNNVEQVITGLTRCQDRQHFLLVGHEPLVGKTAAYWLAGTPSGRPALEFKRGSLCHIEVESPAASAFGTLRFLITPKQLRLLA